MSFSTIELQILEHVDSDGSSGKFKTRAGADARVCSVTNSGSEDGYIIFADKPTEVPEELSGSQATLVPAGKTVLLEKFNYSFFAARTKSGETSFHLHAGRTE